MTRQGALCDARWAFLSVPLSPWSSWKRRVLGYHIEMSSDGGEYPTGTLFQPDEASYTMVAQDVYDLVNRHSEFIN